MSKGNTNKSKELVARFLKHIQSVFSTIPGKRIKDLKNYMNSINLLLLIFLLSISFVSIKFFFWLNLFHRMVD